MGHFVADLALDVAQNMPGLFAFYMLGVAGVAFWVGEHEQDGNRKGAITAVVIGVVAAAIFFPIVYGATKAYCNSTIVKVGLLEYYGDSQCANVFKR